nr:hypothetical protein [Morganella morganii]
MTGIQPYGAFVSLDNETQGLIHCFRSTIRLYEKYPFIVKSRTAK